MESALIDPTTSEFMKQFAGSGAANMITLGAFGLFWCVRRLCARPSRCKSRLHCCCLDVDISDKTLRELPETKDEAKPEEV